ncbi:21 kDa protein-like [Momordica charantia]|uniref:21 kDa protein-like n=1 Tax=Momordica charantia TaxID=3673 RepID=A0A6J1CJ83_MOMCH|nr:21 kDa protein-like [Momordica charantia]
MESQTLKLKSLLIILFFFLSTTLLPTSAVASSAVRPPKAHIRKACKPTPYPRLCEASLSLYASETKRTQQELCRAALVSSLKAAQNATSTISTIFRRRGLSRPSPYEAEVIGDCTDNLKDSIDELRRASAAIKSLYRTQDVEFQISSIKTWVSAAETDVMTCTDGVNGDGGRKVRSKVKSEVKKSTMNVIRQISNALSLINNLKYK